MMMRRATAGGGVRAIFVARACADGYTLLSCVLGCVGGAHCWEGV